jgi:hypothetical protein
MKKKILLGLLLILNCSFYAFSQTNSIHDYNTSHEYIFDANIEINQCDAVGGALKNASNDTAKQGYVFHIKGVVAGNGSLIIQFDTFNPGTPGVKLNGKYFLLPKTDFTASCSDNIDASKWGLNYGVLAIPFKFRPTKTLFTNNLNLGSSIYLQYQNNKNWSNGFVLGISLSSVTLDSLSTKGTIKTNSDRPAFTPSLSYVVSFKNISFTAGLGLDVINKTSVTEKSWIFNGKPWIGFGIGINLFSSNNNGTTTTKSSEQK